MSVVSPILFSAAAKAEEEKTRGHQVWVWLQRLTKKSRSRAASSWAPQKHPKSRNVLTDELTLSSLSPHTFSGHHDDAFTKTHKSTGMPQTRTTLPHTHMLLRRSVFSSSSPLPAALEAVVTVPAVIAVVDVAAVHAAVALVIAVHCRLARHGAEAVLAAADAAAAVAVAARRDALQTAVAVEWPVVVWLAAVAASGPWRPPVVIAERS